MQAQEPQVEKFQLEHGCLGRRTGDEQHRMPLFLRPDRNDHRAAQRGTGCHTHWYNEVWGTSRVVGTEDGWVYSFLDDDLVPQSIGHKDDRMLRRLRRCKGYPFPDGMRPDEFGLDFHGVDIEDHGRTRNSL